MERDHDEAKGHSLPEALDVLVPQHLVEPPGDQTHVVADILLEDLDEDEEDEEEGVPGLEPWEEELLERPESWEEDDSEAVVVFPSLFLGFHVA